MASVWLWVCNQPHTISGVNQFNPKCSGGHHAETFSSVASQPFAFDAATVAIIVPAVASVLAVAWSVRAFKKVIK